MVCCKITVDGEGEYNLRHLIPEEYRKISRAAMGVITFTVLLVAALIYLDRITNNLTMTDYCLIFRLQ